MNNTTYENNDVKIIKDSAKRPFDLQGTDRGYSSYIIDKLVRAEMTGEK